MDSDLPLLEISGEDDSLIQQTPTLRNDAVKVTDAFFSISPLQLPISPINQSMKNNVAPKRAGCSSPKISNKENMNYNKAEGPRLTPHQMKRRKKGYNLRKSLAWDKAFFTEEGVLDPDELSMISGSYGNSYGEALPAISEERMKSPYSSSKYKFASENLQAFSASKNGKNGGLLQPQHNLLAADSKGAHSNGVSSCNRSGIKSGRCPRPLPSSSLKRPAHVHNTRSATKDSHLPKIPDHKSGPHSLLKASKSSMLGTGQLKHNQIARPTVNTHKDIPPESSCKNVKSTLNKEKSDPKCTQLLAKASAQPSRENMANSTLEVNSFTNLQGSQIRKPTRSSEANLKPDIPSSTVLSGEGLYRPKTVAGLPSRSTSITVGNESQLQKVKPSGLRMPSPSLGYFAQNNIQPSNTPKCTVIGSRKSVRNFRAPHAPKSIYMDIPENSTAGLSSSMQCPEVAASKAAMPKAIKSDLMVSDIKNGNIRLLPDKSSEPKRSKHAVHVDIGTEENIGRHGKHKNIKEIAYELDTNVHSKNDPKLLESETCEKSQEDNHGRRVYIQCQNQMIDMKISLCKPENISTSSDLIDGQLVNHNEISNIKKKMSTLSYNLEPQNHCLGVEQTFQCNPSIHSEEFQGKEANAVNEYVIPERNEFGEIELSAAEVISAISVARSQDGELDTNLMTEQLPLEQSGSVEATLPVEIQDSSTGPHSRHEVESIDNATSPNVGKPFLCEVSGSWVQYDLASLNEGDKSEVLSFRNDCIMECVTTDFCLDGTGEGKTVEASQIECIDNIIKEGSTLARSQDGELDTNLMTVQLPLEAQSGSVEATLPVEIQDCSTGPHSRHEVESIDNATFSNVRKPFLCEVSGSWVQYDQASLNEGDKSEALSSRNECIKECVTTNFCLDGTGEGKTVEASQIECIDNIIKEGSILARSQDGELDTNLMTGQLPLEAQSGSVEATLPVEIQDSSIGPHPRHEVESIDNATSPNVGKPFLCEVSGSWVQYDQASLKEGDKSEVLSFRNDCIKECVTTDFCLDGTGEGKTVEASQIECIDSIIKEGSTLRASVGSEADCSQHVSSIQDSSIGPHPRHEVESIDNATSPNVGKPFLCEVSGSWVQYDQASLNESNKSEVLSFRNDCIKECVATDFCLDGTGEGKTVEASQIECIDSIIKEGSTLRASIGSEADCSPHVSQFQNFKRTHEDTSGVDLLTSKSRVKISQQQHMNITEISEQFREESNLSLLVLVNGQLLNHTEICNSKSNASTSSDNLELQSPCLEVEQNSQCNPTFYSEKFHGKDANASKEFVIRENNEVDKSESYSSEVILALSVAGSQDGEFDMNQITEQLDLQEEFGFVEVSPAVETQDCSTGTQIGHQVEPVDNDASFIGGKHLPGVAYGSCLQYDQDSYHEGRESDAHSYNNDAIMEFIENDSCLDGTGKENTVAFQIESTGRIVEESSTMQTSSGSEATSFQHLSQFQNFEKTQEDRSEVDILTNKSNVKTSQQQDMSITLTTEKFSEESNLSSWNTIFNPCFMDSVEAYMKDKDASTSTRKQPEWGRKPNCTKIPQNYAVRFSNAFAGAREEHDDHFAELPDTVKPLACDAKKVSYVERQTLGCDISKDTSRNRGVTDLTDLSSSEMDRNSNEFLYRSKQSEQESDFHTIVHQLSTSSDLIEGLRDHRDNFHSESKSQILMDTLKLQSPCLEVEQNYQCKPEVYTKELRGDKVNANYQFVICERSKDSESEINGCKVISAPSPAQSKKAEFDLNRLKEQRPLEAQFDLVEVSPTVDIQDCSTDVHLGSEVVPIDNVTSLNAAKPFLGEVSGSFVPYDQALIQEGGYCDAHSLRNNAIMECVAADSSLDGTAEGETVEVFQNENTDRIVEESSVLRASSGSEARCFKHSEFANLEREHNDTNGVDFLSSKSHVKISQWQYKNIIGTTEQFKEESYLSGSDTVSDQCSGDSSHAYMKGSDATSSIKKKSESGTKPNHLIIPPPDAVPFSDEWLAAIEAAGEDILTKKSGAVQNSPPEKSLPEPSPWSPVKRKTNEIGPFDCTKCTNTQPADL
ncbi:uncharacterized protein LOC141696988 isoform X3 [Apium graveolens]|uniref:uncharacterized protein LOC141696988 isoform X3 n=1 Tax=Apium graveolens TaxID=4045 RepID=UPI003D7AD63B